jgi:hypothetical protein
MFGWVLAGGKNNSDNILAYRSTDDHLCAYNYLSTYYDTIPNKPLSTVPHFTQLAPSSTIAMTSIPESIAT